MARHFAALKLALMRGGLRRGGKGSVVALVITLAVSLFVGGMFALALASTRSIDARDACDIAAVVFALLAVGWALGPVLALAADSTIDIDRLALFPLTARQLMPGLLVAALIGVGGAFTSVVLFGVFVGISGNGASALFALAAVALEMVICLALSRWVSTSLSVAASKRRWRDVALFIGPVLALVINLGVQTANRTVFVDDPARRRIGTNAHALSIARQVFRWLPTGWPADAVRMAREGRFVVALGLLLLAAQFAIGLVALWWRAIQRATTTTGSPGVSTKPGHAALFPRLVSWLPYSALGAIVAKELRYTWREPRRRAGLLGLVFTGVFPLVVLRGLAASNSHIVFIAVWPALNIGLNANAFGFDADRIWVDVAAGVAVAEELRARTLARLVASVPIVLVLIATLAAFAGSAASVVPALGVVAASTGIGAGFAAVLSVRTPFPMPDGQRGNAFGGGGSGENASSVFLSLGAIAVAGLLVAPLIVLSVDARATTAVQAAIAAIGFAIGAVAWRIGLAAATSARRPDGAELLTRLARA